MLSETILLHANKFMWLKSQTTINERSNKIPIKFNNNNFKAKIEAIFFKYKCRTFK